MERSRCLSSESAPSGAGTEVRVECDIQDPVTGAKLRISSDAATVQQARGDLYRMLAGMGYWREEMEQEDC